LTEEKIFQDKFLMNSQNNGRNVLKQARPDAREVQRSSSCYLNIKTKGLKPRQGYELFCPWLKQILCKNIH